LYDTEGDYEYFVTLNLIESFRGRKFSHELIRLALGNLRGKLDSGQIEISDKIREGTLSRLCSLPEDSVIEFAKKLDIARITTHESI